MDQNLQINKAMNYRYDNREANIKCDEYIVTKAEEQLNKGLFELQEFEKFELYASMSSEIKASKLAKDSLEAAIINQNRKARVK